MHSSLNGTTDQVRRQQRFRRLVAACDRDQIEDAVDALIRYLDMRSGDPDLDQDGDDQDYAVPTFRYTADDRPAEYRGVDTELDKFGPGGIAEDDELVGGEDDFMCHSISVHGAGCPIADPGGGAVDDEGEGLDEREPEYGI